MAVVGARAAEPGAPRLVHRAGRAVALEQPAAVGRAARREEVLARAELEREVALEAAAPVLARGTELAAAAVVALALHGEPAGHRAGRGAAVGAAGPAADDGRAGRRLHRGRRGRRQGRVTSGLLKLRLLRGHRAGHGQRAEGREEQVTHGGKPFRGGTPLSVAATRPSEGSDYAPLPNAGEASELRRAALALARSGRRSLVSTARGGREV